MYSMSNTGGFEASEDEIIQYADRMREEGLFPEDDALPFDLGTDPFSQLLSQEPSNTPSSHSSEQALPGSSPEYGADSSTKQHGPGESPNTTISPEVKCASSSPDGIAYSPYAFNQSGSATYPNSGSNHPGFNEQIIDYQMAPVGFADPAQPNMRGQDYLQPFTSVTTPVPISDLEKQYYAKVKTIKNIGTGPDFKGTIGEFAAKYPHMRKDIAKMCKEWMAAQDSATQAAQVPEQIPELETVPRQKGQFTCSTCGGKLVINGNNDGKKCTKCFTRANKDIQYQNGVRKYLAGEDVKQPLTPSKINGAAPLSPSYTANSAEVNSTGKRQLALASNNELEGDENADSHAETKIFKVFQGNGLPFQTVEEARQYLLDPPVEVCQRPDLEDDDWQFVKHVAFDGLCLELLGVLAAPGSCPSGLSDTLQEHYTKRNAVQLSTVKKYSSTAEQVTQVQAQVMVLFGEVVRVHEVGVSKAVFQRANGKTNCGYEPEMDLTCSARARKIIEYAKISKYICKDIVEGDWKNFEKLARAPTKYFEKKIGNFSTNDRRRNEGNTKQASTTATTGTKKKSGGTKGIKPIAAINAPDFNGLSASQLSNYNPFPQNHFGETAYESRTFGFQGLSNSFSYPAFTTAGTGEGLKRGRGFDGEAVVQGGKRARLGDLGEDEEGTEWN